MCRPKTASGKAATSGAGTPAAAAVASEGKGKGRSGGAKKRPPVDAGISKKIESDDKEVEKVVAKMLNMVGNRQLHSCMSGACLLSARQASSHKVGAGQSCDWPRLQPDSCLLNCPLRGCPFQLLFPALRR